MHLAVSLNIASEPGQSGLDFAGIADIARQAEAAGVDMLVISDAASDGRPSNSPFEATTLVAALATVTERIGLVASASTLMHQPYNLARRFASLDIISQGRAGWSATLAQSPREAANFSRPEGFAPDDFRRRAQEFIGIVRGLWQGWDRDALLFDKGAGRFHDPGKMHLLDHKGEFFSVRGPLNVARSPQDAPLMVMSGLTPADLDFAAGVADIMLINAPTPGTAKAAGDDLQRRALAAGRGPGALKVLVDPGPETDAVPPDDRFLGEGCDGLNLVLRPGLSASKDFAERVLPWLQRRPAGRSVGSATLRGRLGLGAGGEQ
ncbi:MAG: nitrilotriacetate monooxygenase [Mesorhizobium sp. SCN 65-12]|nr:MAG: nitrilotriacetate monooxygenase [Mesorhizobium sp. SCN 65-12]